MNSLRIRVIKLERGNVVNYDAQPYAVVVSQDNLIWWTISRHADASEAVAAGHALEVDLKANQLNRASAVVWATKVS